METWTPEQWVVFIAALVGGLVTLVTPLVGVGKYYIDHKAKASDKQLREMDKKVAGLELQYATLQQSYNMLLERYVKQGETLALASAEIVLLRTVLHQHDIDVPALAK
jgi:hypothetical protein